MTSLEDKQQRNTRMRSARICIQNKNTFNYKSLKPDILSCLICDNTFNKYSHSVVPCEYCEFIACRTCYEKYLNNEGIAKCMNKDITNGVFVCDVVWSRRHLSKNMSKSFMMKDYKEMQEKILFDTQRALLPATIEFVKIDIAEENRVQELYDIKEELTRLETNKNALNLRLSEIMNNTEIIIPIKICLKQSFIRSCPSEDCRGFLNAAFVCDLCLKQTCISCHENIIDTQLHHCDPGLVATAKLIGKDTKPCPNCHEGIFKIDGCDQMFCTGCNTAFSWKTGNIEQRLIHNPHYFEWMRQNHINIPRTEDNTAPGQCPDPDLTNVDMHVIQSGIKECEIWVNSLSQNAKFNNDVLQMQRIDCLEQRLTEVGSNIFGLMQARGHLLQDESVKFVPNTTIAKELEFRKLRVKYLRNFISESTFTTIIQRRAKDDNKRTELTNIIALYHSVTNDILKRLVGPVKRMMSVWQIHSDGVDMATKFVETVEGIWNECLVIEKDVNEMLVEIGKSYHMKKTKQIVTSGYCRGDVLINI